jgi:hypothetical protein
MQDIIIFARIYYVEINWVTHSPNLECMFRNYFKKTYELNIKILFLFCYLLILQALNLRGGTYGADNGTSHT